MSYTSGERACHAMPPVKEYVEKLIGRELTELERIELMCAMSEGIQVTMDKDLLYREGVKFIG